MEQSGGNTLGEELPRASWSSSCQHAGKFAYFIDEVYIHSLWRVMHVYALWWFKYTIYSGKVATQVKVIALWVGERERKRERERESVCVCVCGGCVWCGVCMCVQWTSVVHENSYVTCTYISVIVRTLEIPNCYVLQSLIYICIYKYPSSIVETL